MGRALINYIKKCIHKETTIETKNMGTVVGRIVSVDRKMNLIVEDAVLASGFVKRLSIRGSSLRSFEL